MTDTPRMDAAEGCYDEQGNQNEVYEVGCQLERELAAANAARGQIGGLKARIAELNAQLDASRRPLQAAYERFKHLDRVFEMVQDSDGTENTDPFHAAARDFWRAVKGSLRT